ncbi:MULTISPECIES: LLM class flavin-dependent oxidoreductase [unclassified Amycolatopsis]|uniref:LLM class flavin-dependent oxidoreductase n=1 Tax=unclassified Amycolatopsis TaxID=2618356 RepID=UPI00287B6C33|nr:MULTISPECIES: LLM class flavin-dependent oxidoreductase [unclassified Amycolatopsis]
MTRFLALGAFLQEPTAGPSGFAFHADIARLLERGRFDAVLVADDPAAKGLFEPLTLLSALSTVTRHIGLVGTVGTTGRQPYHVARKFASLDHLSHGRAGWQADRGEDHGRADEFADVVRQLWDSFSDKAMIRDVATARYYDPDQLRTPEHRGEHFRVRGPLNISRPPQGHPVVFVTGTGPGFAARHGDVFLVSRPDVATAIAIRAAVEAAGRKPAQIRVWAQLFPLEAGTPEQLADRMQEWFTEGAADGFTVSFPSLPGPAIDFVRQVVPILRRRGLVPDGYHGTTLRENLGLARPEVTR